MGVSLFAIYFELSIRIFYEAKGFIR